MKILAGSFGMKGRASIKGNKALYVKNSNVNTTYEKQQITSATASSEKEKKFSFLSFIIALLIFGWLGLLGPIGLIIGVILAIACSRYSIKKYSVVVRFEDGNEATLAGSRGEVNRLVKMVLSKKA